MQRNWLGRSQGAKFKFLLSTESGSAPSDKGVDIFTTRPDTLFGVQFVALSLTHPIVTTLAQTHEGLRVFVEQAHSLSPGSKEGFEISGLHATNPLSSIDGMPHSVADPLPVFVAPYVLENYGEGAVMGVPGHDARDYEFWQHNRPSDPIHYVIDKSREQESHGSLFTSEGYLNWRCGIYYDYSSQVASKMILKGLSTNGYGKFAESWRLRDWLISRQRYWGTPIPIIHCVRCGAVPVPENQLPVKLPDLADDWFKKIGNPLQSADDWINTTCPSCGGDAKRDTDTMDTFMDSSWYFMRFVDPHNSLHPFSPVEADALLPVDVYIGGIEHAILHLLYARFLSKFLSATPLWPTGGGPGNKGEPFRRLITQGMVQGKTYSNPQNGRFLKREDVDLCDPTAPKIMSTGEAASVSWEKMSKSKHNGVDPSEFIQKYGADVTRAHLLFQAPIGEVLQWEEERIAGIQRWFGKMWRHVTDVSKLDRKSEPLPPPSSLTHIEISLLHAVRKTTVSVTDSCSKTYALNTVISDLMQLTNALSLSLARSPPVLYIATSTLLRLLAPVAPAFAEECWETLHAHHPPKVSSPYESIFAQPYPVPTVFDDLAAPATQMCAVQENGKLRFAVPIPKPPLDLMDDAKGLERWVLTAIGQTDKGTRWLNGQREKTKVWKKIIVVKMGTTVNFVG